MDSFMSVATWSPYQGHNSSSNRARNLGHLRSQSSTTGPNTTSLPTVKPRSNTEAPAMATDTDVDVAPPPMPLARRLYAGITDADYDMSTIPDPRSRSMTPAPGDETSTAPTQHPDLSDEVATLSTKLISAINHQTTLDDTLSQTRAELERSRETVRQLEFQLEKQREMLAGDIWVRRKSVEAEKNNLMARIAEEKKLRLEVEAEKKKIEQELENLTAELFEEANNMVISEKENSRRDVDAIQRKNDLLKAQLADTEGLLKSQQEQLAELKHVMEQMNTDRDDTTATTTPSSPGFSKFESRDDETPISEAGSQSGLPELITPSYPTSFAHLLQPILRTDLNAFEDFVALCKTSGRGSRPSSGTHMGLGLGLTGPVASAGSIPSSGSTVSLTSMGSPSSSANFSPQTPNTPASSFSTTAAPTVPIPPLKDTKFYKRALAEDVEPTLRLDIAPGLSWLARRSVVTAMSDGSLVVEPVPTTGVYATLSKPQLYPCSLCGDSRKDEEHLRRHRFRTSESSSAQRYPLCKYCLNRVRSTCDFLAFLRIVKDGHWRADDEDAEKAAWEESVKLREQMFWARIGGGVRPIVQNFVSAIEKSPRVSHEETTRQEKEVILTPETVKAIPTAVVEREIGTTAPVAEEPTLEAVAEKDFVAPVSEVVEESSPKQEEQEVSATPAPEAEESTSPVDEDEEDDFVTPALEADNPILEVEEEDNAPAAEKSKVAVVEEPVQQAEAVVNDRAMTPAGEESDRAMTPAGEESDSDNETVPEPRTPQSNRVSAQSLAPSAADSQSSKRLSIEIPGGFP